MDSTRLEDATILVVGGTGFLAGHLVKNLLSEGVPQSQIHVMEIGIEQNTIPSVKCHQADIASSTDVKRVLEQVRPTVIFHAAATEPSETDQTILERVNVVGTRKIIEHAKIIQTVRAFVFTSSAGIAHNGYIPRANVDEREPAQPHHRQPDIYLHTKAFAEGIVLAANRSGSSMLTVSIRPAELYGEGDTHVIPNLVHNARAGRAKIRIGSGSTRFDTNYVGNCTNAQILAAKALLRAANSPKLPDDEKVEGEAFFVTDEGDYSLSEITWLVAESAECPVRAADVRTIPFWLAMILAYFGGWLYWIFTLGRKDMNFSTADARLLVMNRNFCTDKIKKRLGYSPLVSTEEGIERAVKWYLEYEKKTQSAGKKEQ